MGRRYGSNVVGAIPSRYGLRPVPDVLTIGNALVDVLDHEDDEFLAAHDIIVNCVLQDTDAPAVFMTEDDLPSVRRGTLVIDVSCDEGMGFIGRGEGIAAQTVCLLKRSD